MKHFRLFSLFFGCWLLASCTADPGTEPGPFGENPPTAEKPHAVPVEQALEELQSVLEEIDIPAEDGAVTRSEATADVEDLLYIVNFENEAGYAILGADDRLEPVYAVVDEGSLTTEEFRYAVTVTPEQAEADGELVFPLQMVAQAAIGGVDTGGGGNGIVGGPITDIEHWWPEGQQPVGIDYEPWETKEQSGILLKTRWNQTKPYNYLCPIENGKNCFAGCVPVAVAQILVFNALNYNKKFYQIGDQLLNEAMWLNIEEAVTHPQLVKPVVSGESMNAQTWAVAYFINILGEAVGVKYHSDDGGSPAPTKYVVKLLQYLGDIGLGYSNIALSPITTDKVRDMIFVKKLPFYYSGKSSTNSHAWVLDGWLLRERRVITRYAFLPTQYHTESKEFVHANFGWGGQKDGYYTFNAFYTDRGPVSPQSIEDRDYDHDFSAVTYNLSK